MSRLLTLLRRRGGILSRLTTFFKADEDYGLIRDAVGGKIGTPVGGPVRADGKVGYAVSFTGSRSQYVTSPNHADYQMGETDFTVAFRFKAGILTNTAGLVGKATGGNNPEWYILLLSTGRIRFRIITSGGTISVDSSASSPISTDTWYDVRCRRSLVDGKIYIKIDDGPETSATVTGTASVTVGNLEIGRFGSIYHTGQIDDIAIWKRALTDAEWAIFRNGGTGRTHPFTDVPSLSIISPHAYQVIQRTGTTADMVVAGVYTGSPDGIEVRWNGGSWTAATVTAGRFTATLSAQAQGQGTLEARFADAISVSASVAYASVGLIVAYAGQSNRSYRGLTNQVYSHPTLVASNFGNDCVWKNLTDPFDSPTGQIDTISIDVSAAGSSVPLQATLMLARGVPFAAVPCALGGSPLSAWLPAADPENTSTLFGSLVHRMKLTGATLAIFGHGETDAQLGTSQATYAAGLNTIADALATAIPGAKLMVCVMPHATTSITDPNRLNIQNAQLAAPGGNANIVAGADLSDLPTDDGLHIRSTAGLQIVADRDDAALVAAGYA